MRFGKSLTISTNTRKICLLSEKAFSLLSAHFFAANLAGTALDTFLSLTDDHEKNEFDHELERVLDSAYERAESLMNTDTQIKIFKELSYFEKVEDISELIKKTSLYEEGLCSNPDLIKIVGVFESVLEEEIAKNELVYRVYVRKAQKLTIDCVNEISQFSRNLESYVSQINKTTYESNLLNHENNSLIKETKQGVEETRSYITRFMNLIAQIINGAAFIIFETFIYIILLNTAFSSFETVSKTSENLIIIILSFTTSHFIQFCINQKEMFLYNTIPNLKRIAILKGLMSAMFTIAVLAIIASAINSSINTIFSNSIIVLFSSITAILFSSFYNSIIKNSSTK